LNHPGVNGEPTFFGVQLIGPDTVVTSLIRMLACWRFRESSSGAEVETPA
jgi:hypothetical protein